MDRLRRQGKDLIGAIELVNDLHGAVQLQNRLEELRPHIQAKMPATGGVLVAAYVDETRVGEGSVRTLRSVQIIGAYRSEKEARDDLARSHVKPSGPTQPFVGEPNPRVRTTPRYFWYAAPVRTPQLAKPEELAAAREKVSRLLAAVRKTWDAETARLDIEWQAIQKENSRLNKNRRFTKPGTPAAAKVYEDGKKEIDTWEASERRAIAADKALAGAEDRAAAEAQKRIADYRNRWRCPAGLTYEECERQQNAARDIHLRERQEFRAHLGQLEAESARHQRQAAQSRQAAEVREARLPAGRDARARDLDVRVKAVEKGKEAAEALAKEQAAFRDRLSRFNEEDEAVRRLRATIKDMEQVLARLQPPNK